MRTEIPHSLQYGELSGGPLVHTSQNSTKPHTHLVPAGIRNYCIHDAILHRLVSSEEKVTVRIPLHLLKCLVAELRQKIVQRLLVVHHLHGLQFDVRRLTASASKRLMDLRTVSKQQRETL